MTLSWNEDYGTFIFISGTSKELVNSAGQHGSRSCRYPHELLLFSAASARHGEYHSHHNNADSVYLEMDMYELLLLLKSNIDPAKSTGIICLIGIGLGFGLTSWIIHKFYHRSRQKSESHDTDVNGDILPCKSTVSSPTHKGLGSLLMGNNSSLHISAGIQIGDGGNNDSDTPGIRHRNVTSKSNGCGASIVEGESGAHISRTAESRISEHTDCCINVLANHLPDTESNGVEADLTSITAVHEADARCLQFPEVVNEPAGSNIEHKLTVNTQAPTMNDSGYLDIDTCDNAMPYRVTSDDASSNTEIEPCEAGPSNNNDLEAQLYIVLDSNFSDFSSGRGSCEADSEFNAGDEDVLRVELETVDDIDEDRTFTSNEPSNSTLISEDLSTEHLLTPSTSDCLNDSLSTSPQPSPNADELRIDLLNGSSCLDSTASSFSPTSRSARESESSRPNSVINSPLLTARSCHSRSSSITSSDIDLEASSVSDVKTKSDIEIMEWELQDIKHEISRVEDKLESLSAVDTTELYFNVDGMRKLTEVVLNSDDINLTSSEIAKAFQILRKYRYTFTTPERKPTSGHKDAESILMQGSTKKTLPYLDLADPFSRPPSGQKAPAVADWLEGLSNTTVLDESCEAVTEFDIRCYARSHPLYAKGYSKLTQEYGFSKMVLMNMNNHAGLAAAYAGKILHSGSTRADNELDVDILSEELVDIVQTSHSYLESWELSHITHSTDVVSTMKLCLKTTIQQLNRLRSIRDRDEKLSSVLDLMNHAINSRTLIIEGIRILMFLRVNDLYQKYVSGDDMPLYGWILFTRESSRNPRYYFTNHIKCDQERELEQVDLNLLADTLRITLQVFRPLDANSDIFCDFYPETEITKNPCVPLAFHCTSLYALLS